MTPQKPPYLCLCLITSLFSVLASGAALADFSPGEPNRSPAVLDAPIYEPAYEIDYADYQDTDTEIEKGPDQNFDPTRSEMITDSLTETQR